MHTIIISPGNTSDENRSTAGMLANMYFRWLCLQDDDMHRVWLLPGDPGQYEIRFDSDTAASQLANESGFHRLTRISPHDPQGRRHTTFCEVSVDGATGPTDGPRRSYTLDPLQVCVDHVTGRRTDKVLDVLDGNLELIWQSANY